MLEKNNFYCSKNKKPYSRCIKGLNSIPIKSLYENFKITKKRPILKILSSTIKNSSFQFIISKAVKRDFFPQNLILIKSIFSGESSKMEFKVNDLIMLKLENGITNIYVAGKRFRQCKSIIINIPINEIDSYDEINSIDELIDDPELLTEDLEVPNEETEFWAHCSNLQAWVENNYDTRIIHSNLSFPLLKRLTEKGDDTAKRMFKNEIAERFASGYGNVQIFLAEEGYLNFLNKEERSLIFSETFDVGDFKYFTWTNTTEETSVYNSWFDLIENEKWGFHLIANEYHIFLAGILIETNYQDAIKFKPFYKFKNGHIGDSLEDDDPDIITYYDGVILVRTSPLRAKIETRKIGSRNIKKAISDYYKRK